MTELHENTFTKLHTIWQDSYTLVGRQWYIHVNKYNHQLHITSTLFHIKSIVIIIEPLNFIFFELFLQPQCGSLQTNTLHGK